MRQFCHHSHVWQIAPCDCRSFNSSPLKRLRAGRASPSTNFLPGTSLISCALMHQRSLKTCRDFAKHSYGRNRNNAKQRTPPNFGVKLMRPGFGPAAELPALSPAGRRHGSCSSRLGSSNVMRGNCRAAPASARGTGRTAYTKDVSPTNLLMAEWLPVRLLARSPVLCLIRRCVHCRFGVAEVGVYV
jgi:hypothetical protein